MPGRWEDAERSLDASDPAAADEAQQRASIAASSAQYVAGINTDVEYFLDLMGRQRQTEIDAILRGPRSHTINETQMGRLWVAQRERRIAEWCQFVPYADWPRPSGGSDHRFAVRSDGLWYFGSTVDGGDIRVDFTEYEYGFDEQGQFVPSAFPPIVNGTVGTIVRKALIGMLRHYSLPLP